MTGIDVSASELLRILREEPHHLQKRARLRDPDTLTASGSSRDERSLHAEGL